MQLTRSEFVEYIKQNIDELSSFEVMAGCPITDDLVTFLNKPKSQFLKEEFSSYDKTGHEGMLLVPPTIASAMIELAKGRLKDEPWNRRVLLADKWGSLIMCCINSLYDGCLGAFLSEGIKDTKPYDRAIIGYIYKYCISIVLDESGMSFLKYIFLPKLLMYKDFSLDTSSLYTDKNKLRLKSNMNIVALCKKEYWKSFMKNVPLLSESGFESINKQYKQLPYLTYQFAKQRLENGREDFNMKFDVVIGNPPYNNDLYLDFVQTGYNLLKDDGEMVMITPAKWQAKGGKKNEDFRANIVPHMKEITYFRKGTDVFPETGMCNDGVCYYSIYKDKDYVTKNIDGVMHSNWQVRYGFDNLYIRLCEKIQSMGDTLIVDSGDDYKTPMKSYFTSANFGDVKEDVTSRYSLRSSARCIRVPERVFKNISDMDKYKVYVGHFLVPNQVFHLVEPFMADVRDDCLLGFGTKEFCESLISYYKCRLIWFLVYHTNCGNASKEAFINVPDPGQFDHIFTDDELYKKYNLTQDEINIIESVIKERK